MARKRKLLNVRAQLERIIILADDLTCGRYVKLPPLFQDELQMMRFLARCTLNKAARSRKDLRVEAQ